MLNPTEGRSPVLGESMNNGAVSAVRQSPKGATKAAKTENHRPLIRSQTNAPHISSEPALSRSA